MWKNGEVGPVCTCGGQTIVAIREDAVRLVCSGHSFPLPKKKPKKWPNVTHQEMFSIVEEGFLEDIKMKV
jgi:hypothetical protein